MHKVAFSALRERLVRLLLKVGIKGNVAELEFFQLASQMSHYTVEEWHKIFHSVDGESL